MKKIAVSITTLFIFSFAGCSTENSWIKHLNGKYYGQMWSGGSELGCTTQFSVDKNSSISAKYVMIEPYNTENGEIYDCNEIEEFKIQCKWKDRYGFGDVRLTFSNDYSTFRGYWNDDGKIFQSFKWRGVRQNSHIKQAEIAISKLNMQELLDNLLIVHFREIVKVYPILVKHKKTFFEYYSKYLNLKIIHDDLISFCVTNFSTDDLYEIIKNQKDKSKKISNIENAIKLQGLIIAMSKANNNFDEFLTTIEKKNSK